MIHCLALNQPNDNTFSSLNLSRRHIFRYNTLLLYLPFKGSEIEKVLKPTIEVMRKATIVEVMTNVTILDGVLSREILTEKKAKQIITETFKTYNYVTIECWTTLGPTAQTAWCTL